jgi:hypothetical protein
MTGRNHWLGHSTLLGTFMLTAVVAAMPQAQSVTGVVPNWTDLETWARPLASAREVEHGLGLHVSGPTGPMMLSFTGRLSLRSATAPASLQVVMAPPVMANPNLIRKPTLVFIADDGAKAREVIDATSSVRVDDPAPGAIVRSATARISADAFRRLTTAETLTAEVFGAEVTIRPDQIKAMQALAAKLRLQ